MLFYLLILSKSASISSLEGRAEAEVTEKYTSLYMETHPDKSFNVDASTVDDCSIHGSVPDGTKRDVVERINFVRYLCGLNPVEYESKYDSSMQALAHVLQINAQIDGHDITGKTCANDESMKAAENSNFHRNGAYIQPAEVIDYYLFDDGSGNENVGHRRWILSPTLKKISVGAYGNDDQTYKSAHALRVMDDDLHGNTCDVPFIAWPAPGPFPRHLIPDRWSFSLVSGSLDGQTVSHSIEVDGIALNETCSGKVFTQLLFQLLLVAQYINTHLSHTILLFICAFALHVQKLINVQTTVQ